MDCILCGNNKYEVIHHGVRGNPNIDVLQCKKCGLVRLSQFLSDTNDFYRNSCMHNYGPEVSKAQSDEVADTNRRFQLTLNTISNKIICDFGCGSGGYLMKARSVASQVYGIELETAMCHNLRQQGITCFQSIDEAEKELEGKLDVITLWHVLEHLEDPIEMLQRLERLLAPNGRIYIEVPNAEDALLSLYHCSSFADFTYWECHLFLYNNETLNRLVKKAGLKIKFQTQIQRYPLSNHLYWLINGKPGGHKQWSMMNRDLLDREYAQMLISLGKADTLIAEIESRR